MVDVGPDLLARLSALGFAVGVGALYGLTLSAITSKYHRRFVFEDDATRRDRARIWALHLRNEFDPDVRELAKYTLWWGAAGALLVALGTLLVAGIGAVFL